MRRNNILISLAACLLAAALIFAGCAQKTVEQTAADDPGNKKVILYFGDAEAMYLVPEIREIQIEESSNNTVQVAEAIVKELIAGPADKNLTPSMPAEARLLSLKIEDQTAYVDFSEELRSKHPGGSSGESITVNSLVDSLTELKEIQKVQILINGHKVDTLVGHADLTQPLTRDESMIKK